MSCDNVITVQDLETDKKHSTFYREVITGKAGGTGADIDFATNAVTGQTQKTLTKAINELGGMGYARVGTFKVGATLTTARQTLLWDIADGGDGQEYGWSGTYPKVVPPSSTPNNTGGIGEAAWMSRFDPELQNRVTAVEAKNTEQDSRVTAVEAKNTEQDSRVTAVEAKNTEQDSRLTAVEAKNTEQDSRLASMDAVNSGQNARITTAENDINALKSGQGSGVVGFATRAEMYANRNYPAGTIGYVTNDATAAYNGTYLKSGASGSGSWAISSSDLASQAYQGTLNNQKGLDQTREGFISIPYNNVVADFDFVSKKITVFTTTTTIWNFALGGYQSVSTGYDQVIPIETDTRWLVWNKATNLFRGLLHTERSNIGADDFVVAHLGYAGVNLIRVNMSNYTVNGVSPVAEDKGARWASVLRVSADARPDDVTMWYDSKTLEMSFSGDHWLYIDGYIPIKINTLNLPLLPSGRYGVPFTTAHRLLVLNEKTMELVALTGHNKLKPEYIKVVEFHPTSKLAMHYKSTGYSVDGVDVAISSERTNYRGYVVFGRSTMEMDFPSVNFDFTNGQIHIDATSQSGMYTSTGGFIFLENLPDVVGGKISIPVDSTHRTLVYNYITKKFSVSTGSFDSATTFPRGSLYCATFGYRSVHDIRCGAYIVNGVLHRNKIRQSELLSVGSLDVNKILYNYRLGQEQSADRFNLPFFDTWKKCGINQFNYQLYTNYPNDPLHYSSAGYRRFIVPTTDFIRSSCDNMDLAGKTVATFGGSHVAGASTVLAAWESELGVVCTNYAIGGQGFCTTPGTPNQVDGAGVHDIYILWATTNDCALKATIGTHTSPIDNLSQMGGIGLCVQKIMEKAPTARILLFSSSPAFNLQYMWDTGYIRP